MQTQRFAAERVGEWQLALGLSAEMPEGTVQHNTIAHSAATLMATGRASGSLRLASWLRCRRASCNHLQRRDHAGDKGGEWLLALGILAEMPDRAVQRNTITYNAKL